MSIRFVSLIVMIVGVGCTKPAPLTPAETSKLLDGAPQFIVGTPKVSFEGLPEFHLHQSNEDAEAALKKLCGKPLVYEGGYRRQNATFKGCTTPDHQDLHSFRIGFHPALDNAVFTLEVKRRHMPLPQMRARFYNELETPFEDLPRPGVLRMRSTNYNMFASADKGDGGPVQVVLGINPDRIEDK